LQDHLQRQALKNWFSTSIKELKPNRTQNGVCSKITKPKPNFLRAADEKTKIFSQFSNRQKLMMKMMKKK